MKKKRTFLPGSHVIVILLAYLSITAVVGCSKSGENQSPTRPPGSADKLITGSLGYSGMAVLEGNSYIVVHDTKINKAENHLPRLSVLALDCSGMYRETPIRVNWESKIKRKPNDLEGICPIPGRENEFLAVESGGYRGKSGDPPIFGHIFHFKFTNNHEGEWSGTVKQVIRMPEELSGVEGIACVRFDGTSWLVVLGECGGRIMDGNEVIIKPARLHWDTLDLDSSQHNRQCFNSRGNVEFIAPDLAACCSPVDLRSCSDMYVDAEKRLWISAALDPHNEGPFRSVIYRAGSIDPERKEQVIRIDSELKNTWFIDGVKVEALAAPPECLEENVILSFATDDENYYGIWRPLFADILPDKVR